MSPPEGLKYFNYLPALGLRTLVLHHSQLQEKDLGTILTATPSLKHLAYDEWVNYGIRTPPHNRAFWQIFCCDGLSGSLVHV